jgi:hypothetical protein
MKKTTRRFSCGAAACALAALLASAGTARAAGLTAHWRFEGNGEDASGTGRALTLKNGAAFSADAAEGGQCLLLDKFACASAAPFDLGDAFTITAWTLLREGLTDIKTLVANCEGGSRIDGFKLFVNNWETANHRIVAEPSDGTDRIDVNSPENAYEEGVWNHVALTVDRANGLMEIYLNGLPVQESPGTVTGFQVTRALFVGAMPPGNVYNWQGRIDDLRVYDGVLTEEEVQDAMVPLPTAAPGPFGLGAGPRGFRLGQNFPNPFNPATRIPYHLPSPGPVRLEVFDLSGRAVALVESGVRAAGWHEAPFDAGTLPAGVYLCVLEAGPFADTRKMLLVK